MSPVFPPDYFDTQITPKRQKNKHQYNRKNNFVILIPIDIIVNPPSITAIIKNIVTIKHYQHAQHWHMQNPSYTR